MFNEQITLALENLGFLLFLLAIIIALIDWPIQRIRGQASAYEVFYRWTALLPLGFTALYAFAMHAFFPIYTASIIGWQNSPFQFEVAAANLGFGMIGVLSFRASYGFRLATVIGNTFWLWGDAVGHLYQILMSRDLTVGNAGTWFWMDIIIPLVLIICITRLKTQPSFG
ncbi:MAG: hypothetical protein A3F11_09175 [Gammaproteobacteria bacterium RIFCSPHIGHO2_12_FULL_37_14]|nr:MAG: hypothetical protein A3F11_09175 [Gammaproteobacteria bacterium RIFCSPHIGHO2_12_FULL_37_14]